MDVGRYPSPDGRWTSSLTDEHLQRISRIRDVSKRRAALEKAGLAEAEIEALLEQAHYLVKGKEKFPRASRMRFSREGLAQASSKWTAEYRTWKIRQRLGQVERVLDACSGIGGDAIALATRWKVLAVERDHETAGLLRHNLAAHGVEGRVEIVEGDLLALLDDPAFVAQASRVDCVFFDPSRRGDGARRIDAADYEPPISLIDRLRELSGNLCVKVSPMLDLDQLPDACDLEVVSHKGAVKETLLWFGALRESPDAVCVQATKLPERVTWTRSATPPTPPLTPPGRHLYEPDGAFAKAGLTGDLAAHFGLSALDRGVAFLTSDELVESPLFKRYRVCETLPLSYKLIGERLCALGIGRPDFKARGVAIDLRTVHKKIKSRGRGKGLVVFTRVAGEARALLCRY
ncbi:MAG: hypothetical protein CL910_09955 [Deltaproteobacteria bacterium]|nr:hypothetical protein [Deltaproteobacteria bacterium]